MNIYEEYHGNRKDLKRVISKDDFTYQSILYFLSKYCKGKEDILDVGCGVGTIDFYLGKLGKNVIGIDISKNGILKAKDNARKLRVDSRVKFFEMDFPNIYPRKHFDIIVCSEVLEHLSDDKAAVMRIFNLLKYNGLLIASSPSQNAPLYKMGLLKKFDREVGHLRRYKLESYMSLFENSGFKIAEIKKTEGILRNFLFTSRFGGFLLRILNRSPFSVLVTFIDNLTVLLFGESNIYLVAQKK